MSFNNFLSSDSFSIDGYLIFSKLFFDHYKISIKPLPPFKDNEQHHKDYSLKKLVKIFVFECYYTTLRNY